MVTNVCKAPVGPRDLLVIALADPTLLTFTGIPDSTMRKTIWHLPKLFLVHIVRNVGADAPVRAIPLPYDDVRGVDPPNGIHCV